IKLFGRFKRNRLAVVSAWLLIAVALFVLIYPMFSPYQPQQLSEAQFQPPSAAHWLGTDVHGRDLLARLCYGAKISLMVGVVGATVCLVIGVLWGAVAGWAGGRLDGLMMRTVDILYSMPSIILAIILMTTLEPFLKKLLGGLGPAQATTGARLIVLFIALGAV